MVAVNGSVISLKWKIKPSSKGFSIDKALSLQLLIVIISEFNFADRGQIWDASHRRETVLAVDGLLVPVSTTGRNF